MNIDWKGSWAETLAANVDTNTMQRNLAQNPELREAADRIAWLREITLLREMIGHFPGDKARHAEAYRKMASLYSTLDERPRAVECMAQLAGAFPDDTALAAEGYAGILRYAHPFDTVPDARAWVEYAARGVDALEKAGGLARDHLAADLARRYSCLVLVSEGNYAEARRYLDRRKTAEGGQPWWREERASLLGKAGHLLQAADWYEQAGNKALADQLRAQSKPGLADALVRRTPLELEMRWKAMRDRAKQPGGPLPADAAVIHDALRLSADTDAMQGEDPLFRQAFWSVIDQMLRSAKPADLAPLRELQESKVVALAGEIRRMGDVDGAAHLFRRYAWARSAQELLVDFGEDALRTGRLNWAARAFQDVLSHADDSGLLAAAHVGYWLALAGQPDWREELERAMAAVPDEALLPWRGASAKASEVKAAIRIPAGGAAPLALSSLRRVKLQLPAELAADEPAAPGQQLVSARLGPWTLQRIDAAAGLLAVTSSRHIACYDGATLELLQVCDSILPPAGRAGEAPRAARGRWKPGTPTPARDRGEGEVPVDERSMSAPVWRPAIVGRSWNSTIGGSAGLAMERPAIFGLATISRNGALEHDVAAWEAESGGLLWTTGGRAEWSDLLPQSEPSAGEGRVYVLAAQRKAAKNRPLYLVCLDSMSGALVWQRLLGAMAAGDRQRGLACGGNAIALHQGSLYVSTDAGIVARCDARDGLVEWVRAYPSAAPQDAPEFPYRREGAAPQVAAGAVFIAPRDHTGVMALDPATGGLLWESLLVPSERIVGVAGRMLITQGGGELAALDLGSGDEAWVRNLGGTPDLRATVAGAHVLAVAGDRLLRYQAATGAPVDELRLNGAAGSGFALLADGSLAEFTEEPLPAPAEQPGSLAGPLRLPLAEQWSLPCRAPLLVKGPAAGAGTDRFGVLSGRLLLCVEAQPGGRIVWQSRLRGRPDSVGFHGRLVLAAQGGTLTALNAASGATEWALRLPFHVDLVGGDERLIFAGEMAESGRVAAIDPGTGKALWLRWFGREARLAAGRLQWIGLQEEAGALALRLYWNAALFGSEGKRPAEVVVAAASGTVLDVRRFLPDEPQWPPALAFGDGRAYVLKLPLPPWPGRGPFLPDALAYVGQGSLAHFALLTQPPEPAAAWSPVMDVRPESQYWSSAGLHPTAAGPFVRRVGQLATFDVNSATGVVYDLPRSVDRTAYNLLDFRADTGTVVVVSGTEGSVLEATRGSFIPYLWNGLHDSTGMGAVRIQCFTDQAQVGTSSLGLPEAGSNLTATLLNGQIKQHYRPSCIRVGNISSLGWSKYDVYFYGFIGTASIEGVSTQKCAGVDYSKVEHRTTFIPGVNYMKFSGVSGDEFLLEFSEGQFAAIQIANASPGVARERAAGLGLCWSRLLPTDVVGAEVVCDGWYSAIPFSQPYRPPVPAPAGRTNTVQRARSGVYVDVFDRVTGVPGGTQPLPGEPPAVQVPSYVNQARLLDGGLLTTDAGGVHFFRSGSEP